MEIIGIGQTVVINNIEITALPVSHSIPGNAYWIDSKGGALVFSGDTGSSPEFWQTKNTKGKERKDNPYLKHLIIETSFTNAEINLAKLSGHYHPAQLLEDLKFLDSNCPIWITHLKPDEANKIMEELASHQDGKKQIKALQNLQILNF
jgi:cAMP phosphodiesterase